MGLPNPIPAGKDRSYVIDSKGGMGFGERPGVKE
jgi:hypothetical protein